MLIYLVLGSFDKWVPVVPNSTLSGPAPRLQTLRLSHIPLPAVQKLLLSASDLVHLDLCKTPRPGYISPVVMVTYLSAMTRLEFLQLEFLSPPSHSDRTSGRPRPPTRSILPALISLRFKGVSKYLEDLVARIDVPPLSNFEITFFNQLTFDMSQISQFICRSEKLRGLKSGRYCLFQEFHRCQICPANRNIRLLNARIENLMQ